MNTTALRQQLHEYIDTADDKKIEAVFTILEAEIAHTGNYTEEELQLFYARRAKYLDGNSSSYTAEEAHDYIRNSRKGK